MCIVSQSVFAKTHTRAHPHWHTLTDTDFTHTHTHLLHPFVNKLSSHSCPALARTADGKVTHYFCKKNKTKKKTIIKKWPWLSPLVIGRIDRVYTSWKIQEWICRTFPHGFPPKGQRREKENRLQTKPVWERRWYCVTLSGRIIPMSSEGHVIYYHVISLSRN